MLLAACNVGLTSKQWLLVAQGNVKVTNLLPDIKE